ncbi:hypothetical protein [Rubritepida flocculans]|uniref:hypothetical protein n=1 Tax=Rubritepida flocculans TaxID=182403 RepID=UPI00041011DB|nr:hypothetical protein [Rubritepida flocculans]
MFFTRPTPQPTPPPAPADDPDGLRAELAALEAEAPGLLRRISESNMTIGAEADGREAGERLAHVRRRITELRDRIRDAEAVGRLAEIAHMRRECADLLMRWTRFIGEGYPCAAETIAAGLAVARRVDELRHEIATRLQALPPELRARELPVPPPAVLPEPAPGAPNVLEGQGGLAALVRLPHPTGQAWLDYWPPGGDR